MKHLIYKEFRLASHPTLYLFAVFGIMLLIPSYPYYIAFFYACLSLFFCFLTGRENRDIFYSMTLPISKKEVVKGKCMLVMTAQIVQILFAVPFAILRVKLIEQNNEVGIEVNPAFFGFVFLMFTLFNAVFLIKFFKTGYQVGIAFLLGAAVITIFIIVMEVIIRVPNFSDFLDTKDSNKMIKQIPILIIGILVYFIGMAITYKKAAKHFEGVNL